MSAQVDVSALTSTDTKVESEVVATQLSSDQTISTGAEKSETIEKKQEPHRHPYFSSSSSSSSDDEDSSSSNESTDNDDEEFELDDDEIEKLLHAEDDFDDAQAGAGRIITNHHCVIIHNRTFEQKFGFDWTELLHYVAQHHTRIVDSRLIERTRELKVTFEKRLADEKAKINFDDESGINPFKVDVAQHPIHQIYKQYEEEVIGLDLSIAPFDAVDTLTCSGEEEEDAYELVNNDDKSDLHHPDQDSIETTTTPPLMPLVFEMDTDNPHEREVLNEIADAIYHSKSDDDLAQKLADIGETTDTDIAVVTCQIQAFKILIVCDHNNFVKPDVRALKRHLAALDELTGCDTVVQYQMVGPAIPHVTDYWNGSKREIPKDKTPMMAGSSATAGGGPNATVNSIADAITNSKQRRREVRRKKFAEQQQQKTIANDETTTIVSDAASALQSASINPDAPSSPYETPETLPSTVAVPEPVIGPLVIDTQPPKSTTDPSPSDKKSSAIQRKNDDDALALSIEEQALTHQLLNPLTTTQCMYQASTKLVYPDVEKVILMERQRFLRQADRKFETHSLIVLEDPSLDFTLENMRNWRQLIGESLSSSSS